MTRRTIKRLLIGLIGVFGLGLIALVVLAWYYLPLGPFLDDGPFRGAPTAAIEDHTPDQSFGIFNGFTLEVFDPVSEGASPVVQLRDRTGAVRWAIHADGHDPGDVASIRFTDAHRGLARSGTVHATVHWTFGQEGSSWYITGDGELRDYWYSW